MSAHDDHDAHEGGHGIPFYFAIAVFLGIVTFIELGPLFEWFNIPPIGLLALSAVKFFFVVAFFMHLWDDAPIFSQVFGAPLVGTGLMITVLMLLFHTFNPAPGEDAFAVQERYIASYQGECSSWLQSHRTHRWYCASPAIEIDRMTRVGGGGKPWGTFKGTLEDMPPEEQLVALTDFGEKIYKDQCARCHQANGQGNSGYPPIAGSDYLGDAVHHAGIIANGLSGPITVNGKEYNGQMPRFDADLTPLEIAAVATYERNAWGNDEGIVLPADVEAAMGTGDEAGGTAEH